MIYSEVADIISGSVFLFVGLAACSIAAIGRRSGLRTFVWLGIWSAMFGAMRLNQLPAIAAILPPWFQTSTPLANTAITYLLVVFGSLSFMELCRGKVRLFMQVAVASGLAIAVLGVPYFVLTGSNDRLMPYNHLLAACVLLVVTAVTAAPSLSSKYLVLPQNKILTIGTLLFASEALYVNVSRLLGFETPVTVDHLGFAILLSSFAYANLRIVFANERRLLSIENELSIAREIQTSILPDGVPELDRIRVAAAYYPMDAVAGDFYEFIAVDHYRLGLLVADVSGHGVPAALIASMLKVATQSLDSYAHDPKAVLSGINRILSRQLRGQFVSAAYLWLDTENGEARYSAAGHPPLLRWRQNQLDRIQSNGLLMGVLATCDDYPVSTIQINTGDRFLLYTDGVTEPENADGESFGDMRLEQVVRDNQWGSPSELSDALLSEMRQWQPSADNQQDDITLIVIDLV